MCKEADLEANNAAVDSSSDLQSIISALGGETTRYSCSGQYGTGSDVPQFKRSWCAYSSSSRALSTYDCASAPSDGNDQKRRVCWCSFMSPPPSAPPPPPSTPPPVSPVPTYASQVRAVFRVEGTIDSFDAAQFGELLKNAVSASAVNVNAQAASIRAEAVLYFTSVTAAQNADTLIATTATQTMQTAWFGSLNGGNGIVLLEQPTATIVQQPTAAVTVPSSALSESGGSARETSGTLPLMLGFGAIGIVAAVVIYSLVVYCACRQQNRAKAKRVAERASMKAVAAATATAGAAAVTAAATTKSSQRLHLLTAQGAAECAAAAVASVSAAGDDTAPAAAPPRQLVSIAPHEVEVVPQDAATRSLEVYESAREWVATRERIAALKV